MAKGMPKRSDGGRPREGSICWPRTSENHSAFDLALDSAIAGIRHAPRLPARDLVILNPEPVRALAMSRRDLTLMQNLKRRPGTGGIQNESRRRVSVRERLRVPDFDKFPLGSVCYLPEPKRVTPTA
jgi:hypothetical protein